MSTATSADVTDSIDDAFRWRPRSTGYLTDDEALWNAALIEEALGEHPEIWWPSGAGPWTVEEARRELLRRQQQGQTIKRSVMVATTVAAVASGSVLNAGLAGAVANGAPAVAETVRDTVATVNASTGVERVTQAATAGSTYVVKAGETMRGIAAQHGITTRALISANDVANPDLIFPGQKLTIPSGEGSGASDTVYEVKSGDTVAKLAGRFGVSIGAITGANKIANPDLIIVGQKLTIPGAGGAAPAVAEPQAAEPAKAPEPVKAVVQEQPTPPPPPPPAPAAVQVAGDFVWPTKGVITQNFGPSDLWMEPAYNGYAHFHQGLDLANGMHTAIVAADGGTVIQSGWNGGYGYSVQIDHGNGLVTLYGHMAAQPPVGVGQKVSQGQKIGSMGSTGASTGPHLHFGVKKNGTWVDPLKYLP